MKKLKRYGQTHSNNSSAFADELFECIWTFCGVGALGTNFFQAGKINLWNEMRTAIEIIGIGMLIRKLDKIKVGVGIELLKVHWCRFESLPISLSSYENNMLKISHKIPFTFWDMRTWDMWKVWLETNHSETIEYVKN